MKWQPRVISDDLIFFEKSKKNSKVMIEARPSHDNYWEVYKIYNYRHTKYIEEYGAADRGEAERVISRLKKEKDLTLKQINDLKKIKVKASIKVQRQYRDDNVEKWAFWVDGESHDNFFVMYGEDDAFIDVIVHEKYKVIEKEILQEINNILNLDRFEGECIFNFYYYGKKSEHKKRTTKLVLSEIMLDYDSSQEEGEGFE